MPEKNDEQQDLLKKNNLLNLNSLNLTEPPKFNLNELPEPPKLNLDDDFNKINNLSRENIIEKSNINEKDLSKKEVKLDDLPSPETIKSDFNSVNLNKENQKEKRGGFFSFLFGKKKEEKVELFPKIKNSQIQEEKPIKLDDIKKQTNLNNLNNNDLEFAPPEFKTSLSEQNKEQSNLEIKKEYSFNNNFEKTSFEKSDFDFKISNENTNLNQKDANLEIKNLDTKKVIKENKFETNLNYNHELESEEIKQLNPDQILDTLSDKEKEMLKEAEDYEKTLEDKLVSEDKKTNESVSKNEIEIKKNIPVSEVKGIGEKREQKLKKLGIKTADKLASVSFDYLAKKLKIPEKEAKKIISNAKRITRIKKQLKQAKVKEGIINVVKKLEEERKKLEVIQKTQKINEEKLIEIEGHSELVKILEALEKKRLELEKQEQLLREKELKLASSDEAYKREVMQIENLRRKLDTDIRERTQYLINLEKDYFKRGQELAKKQTELEAKEKELDERYKLLKETEDKLKIKANELEDKSITLNAKEKNYEKIVKELEKQDLILKEKEEDLIKREAEYIKKLDLLESHEKEILKNLEEKRKRLEQKEKEIELKESQFKKKEKLVDKKEVALEYEKDIIEAQKDKLVDDEFEQYLHEQLGLVKNSGINIDDINFTKNIKSINFDDKKTNVQVLYEMIDTCKDLLKNNRINDAKIFYNQLRDKYYNTNFVNQREKETIHNILRNLYDEINLADIGR